MFRSKSNVSNIFLRYHFICNFIDTISCSHVLKVVRKDIVLLTPTCVWYHLLENMPEIKL